MYTRINKIGFEIEGEFAPELLIALKSYGAVKGDGSISPCRKCRNTALNAVEFASHPLHLKNDKKQIDEIFNLLLEAYKTKKFHYNNSMGFHIHISFNPLEAPEIHSKEFYDYFLAQISKTFPRAYSKRKDNQYCRVNNNERNLAYSSDRYNAINFVAKRKHGTVEFRIFPSASPASMQRFLLVTIRTVKSFLRNAEDHLKKEYTLEIK